MKEQHGLSASEQPLHHFSNYDLIRRIDVGGMGEVYLAHQRTAFNRKVAIKIIRSDLVHDTIARKRFLREAEVSAHLKHDHILPLFEFGEEQGRLFIVTPYIEGGTLARRLQSGPLSLAETHQLFTALVQAISYIHKRGVIHRDLKPSNILLDKLDDADQIYVRLIDFGIASLQGKAANPQMTIGGQEMGTLAYLAPERLNGIAAPSNDLYSLGVILFQMLTGELPGSTGLSALPPALDTVVRRSTAINPAERYATADELLKAFEGTYRYLSSQRPVSLPVTAPVSAEVDDSPTPGRIVETLSSAKANSQPGMDTDYETASPLVNPPRQKAGPSPVSPVPQRVKQTPARPGSDPAASSRQTKTTTGAHQSVPPSVARSTSEMPALPARQPATARSTMAQAPGGPRDANQPGQRVTTQRAGLLVHTQDQQSFTRQDYDAPTSHLDPALFSAKQAQLKKDAVLSPSQPLAKVVAPPAKRLPSRSLLALLPISIIIVLLVIGGLSYLTFQASITASVSVTPQAHSISQVFTITAKPGQNAIDQNTATIPAKALNSSKTGSMQGNTTGETNCQVFGILDCQKAVSPFDVNELVVELKPSLQKQITSDLQNQALSKGAQLIGNVVYDGGTIESNPGVGSQSKTVTVSVVEQGSVEYFLKGDAQNLANQLLQQQVTKKFGANYRLIDQYAQMGPPSVQSVDNSGLVTISIASAAIVSYQMPANELSTMQGHIKGMTAKAARAYIVANMQGIDPALISVRLSSGQTIPTNTQQIKISLQSPNVSGLLPLTLPKVKPGISFTP